MSKYFTGIGSRSTPTKVKSQMTTIATELESKGYILRSGAADGADRAFEAGINHPDNKEIYLPWKGFNYNISELYLDNLDDLDNNLTTKAYTIAEQIHPNWSACSWGAKKLHARNVFQVLGKDLSTPSNIVICWAPIDSKTGIETGGTRTACVLAREECIPVANLIHQEHRDWLEKWLKKI